MLVHMAYMDPMGMYRRITKIYWFGWLAEKGHVPSSERFWNRMSREKLDDVSSYQHNIYMYNIIYDICKALCSRNNMKFTYICTRTW